MFTSLRQITFRALLRVVCLCAKPGTSVREALDTTRARVAGGGGGVKEPY